MKGKIKFFDYARGYGFILGDDGNDYFVHITDVEGLDGLKTAYPRAGQRVEITSTQMKPKGMTAKCRIITDDETTD